MDKGSPQPYAAWRLSDVVAVIVLALLVGALATAILAAVVGISPDQPRNPSRLAGGIAATMAVDLVLLSLAVAFSVGKYACRWRDLGFRSPRRGGWWLALATVAALWAVLGIYLVIVQTLDADSLRPESALEEEIFATPLVAGLAAALALFIAPVAEETFFRGFLFPALRRRWGLMMAAFLSGLLFGLAHADLGSLIPFSLIGIVLAVAYAVSGSIWITVVSHFLFNFLSFMASLALHNGGVG